MDEERLRKLSHEITDALLAATAAVSTAKDRSPVRILDMDSLSWDAAILLGTAYILLWSATHEDV